MKATTPFGKNTKPIGEIWVWVSAVGLAAGLFMILFLLSVIVWNGLNFFWPKPIAEITLADEGRTTFRDGRTVAGVITQRRSLTVANLSAANVDLADLAETNPDYMREMQVYTANRDLFATQNFAFLNMGDIQEITYPADYLVLERNEWGNAIVRPRELRLSNGLVIPAESPEFNEQLRTEVDRVRERRATINRTERNDMGRINARINTEELEIRYIKSLEEPTSAQLAELERREARVRQLKSDLDPLFQASQGLRALQNESSLVFDIVGGPSGRSQPLGDIVNFYQPNQMSLLQRTGWFGFKIWEFITDYPREANTEGGIFPALFGTFVMTLLMSLAVTPFGVLAAVYLREYAQQGPLVSAVRISINNLAGVPSIVFGVFGLGFFIHEVGAVIDQIFYPRMVAINTPVFGTGGILWASLTLALMTVPVVIVATEEALAAVSRGVREGSLACGASKWQTIQRLVLPASSPGILTGLILAMARGAGEVAPLLLVGVMALAPSLPVDGMFPFIHLDRKFMHLGFHIYIVALQSPDTEATKPLVFASTLVLIQLVVVLNLGAILIRNHLRKKLQSAAF